MFKKIVICGVGLIGGSFALALRQAGVVGERVGFGRSASSVQQALQLGVIDRIGEDIAAEVCDADLVLLATPVGSMAEWMARIAPHLGANTLVTDGGSTKTNVVWDAYAQLGDKVGQFVPAHPIAGAEKSGAAAAKADLYVGKRVVITPLPENTPAAVQRVKDAWLACGAQIFELTHAEHDAVFAAVSHLPHLLSFALVHDLAQRDNRELLLSFAASGFRDFTRIAASSPEMWRDISLANRDALLSELAAYQAELNHLQRALTDADGAALQQIFSQAQAVRRDWQGGEIVAIEKKINFDDGITILPLVQWLDYVAGFDESVFVALPLIQRGSVWKPDQLISLWDTLLRGMPLGSLIYSKMPAGIKVRKIGENKSIETTEGAIGLIDGQQRTLAMLIAWSKVGEKMDRRIWVDFADKPSDEHLFRLYVTTKNQPFGFQKASPNSKLPLNERRKAWEAFEDKYGQKYLSQDFLFINAKPYHGKSPLDLRILIELWRKDSKTWSEQIKSMLIEQFGNEIMSESITRIEKFATALRQLFDLKIPLIKVNSEVFSPSSDKDDEISDPPLAVLFKRIGTGGTALSDADYAYSVIKHHLPKSYDLVESLHAQHNIAGLLSATDLVMTAVRLAAAEYKSDGKPLTDWESPSKRDFHRLIKQDGFLENGFLPLIQNNGLETAFAALTKLIQYQKESNPLDLGLPLHAFPLLKRPLIQVLLRWIRCVQNKQPSDLNSELNKNRQDVLRFIMYWQLCVTDPKKASSIVFEQLQKPDGNFSGESFYRVLLEKQVAIPIVAPETIKRIKEDVAFSKDATKLRGWKRFQQTDENQKWVIALYQRWWGNGYVHPVLLWLQRDYVATFDGSPVAGRDEDTPYDYDHICPANYWGNWTGEGNNPDSLMRFLAKDGDNGGHWRVGNSIGNVRVWNSSKNRSDGDAAPNIKLKLDSDTPERAALLQQSAIDGSQIEQWKTCSGIKDKGRSWDEKRVVAFQDVVEKRAFTLYERFYNELGFAEWALRESNEIELST